MTQPLPPTTAAMLAIGDEILSGRTKDKNIAHLADVMTMAGIDLKEVRIVGDEPAFIADTLNTLRRQYDFVFTSGGIGPTHDDVTAEAVAAAFSLPLIEHPEAVERLAAMYQRRELPFTEARRRMTRTPDGATLIDNPVSTAPGFRIDNVFVFAGVPSVFQAMLANALKELPAGQQIASEAIECPYGEGDIGDPLAAVQKAHPGVSIGSYPRLEGERFTTQLVLRSRDMEKLAAARQAVEAMLAEIAAA